MASWNGCIPLGWNSLKYGKSRTLRRRTHTGDSVVSERVYEFVIAGRIGPNLRSMLADLNIEDRPPNVRLTLRRCDQVTMLRAVAEIAAGTGEIENIRSGPPDSEPNDT
jgi:hypothetical protein